jgi:putative ABC transport system permease protein
MYLSDLLRLIWRNLGRMRARVAMTAIGVLIGTAAVVILVSLGAGLQRSLTGELTAIRDLTRITVLPGSFGRGFDPSQRPERTEEKVLDENALRFIRDLPHVVAATPRQGMMGGQLRLNRVAANPSIVGLDPHHAEALGLEVQRGVLILGRGQALVGAKVGEVFFDPIRQQPVEPIDLVGQLLQLELSRISSTGNPVTKRIRIRVAGVLAEGGQTDYDMYLALDEVLDMNEWLMGQRLDLRQEGYQQVIVRAGDAEHVQEIEQRITEAGFMAFSFRNALQQVNLIFLILQAVLGGIGAIALVVAGFGIANTMIMAIYERTAEIGLMKAVGARNRDVMSVFLGEAAAIGFLGGVLGVALGAALSQLINAIALVYIRAQAGGEGPEVLVHTPLWLIAFSVGFATLAGLLSGVYPAMRAATLSPVSALKYE